MRWLGQCHWVDVGKYVTLTSSRGRQRQLTYNINININPCRFSTHSFPPTARPLLWIYSSTVLSLFSHIPSFLILTILPKTVYPRPRTETGYLSLQRVEGPRYRSRCVQNNVTWFLCSKRVWVLVDEILWN